MPRVKLFLGTSASLMGLRISIGDALRKLSNQTEKQGVKVELLCWEDCQAEYTGDSKQLEYDRNLVLESDIVIAVFKDKIGEWTAHELDVAKNGGKSIVSCYCLKCSQQNDIAIELRNKGFNVVGLESEQEVVDSTLKMVEEYINSNRLYSTVSKPTAETIKYFYATIPDDMDKYRVPFGNMIRSLDVVTTKELNIHCLLHPYKTHSCIVAANHYVALFNNIADDSDIDEMKEALRCLDLKGQMEAVCIFQQKGKNKGDIRKNCLPIKEIVDARGIFTIGMHRLDKVKLNLLLWCLHKHVVALLPSSSEFGIKDGKIIFMGNPIADLDAIEELANIRLLAQQEQSLLNELRVLKDKSPDDSSALFNKRLELRSVSARLHNQLLTQLDSMMNCPERDALADNSQVAIDCDLLLEVQESEMGTLKSVVSSTTAQFENDEKQLRSRSAYLQQNIDKNGCSREELKKVQDTLLQVVRNKVAIGSCTKMELLAELMHAVGVYDTFIWGYIDCDRDPLYDEIVTVADQMGYSDASVEIMRLNLGNHYSRLLEHDKAIECYENTLSRVSQMNDGSRFIRLSICHFFVATIHSYIELDFTHKRIGELLDSFAKVIGRWEEDYPDDDTVIYRALFQSARLHGIYGLEVDGRQFVEEARIVYGEIAEKKLLPTDHQWFGEVMCYLPNNIASYYLDHYPIDNQNEAKKTTDIVTEYIKEQIKNAQRLLDFNPMEACVYLGKAYHNLGFLCGFQEDMKSLLNGYSYYQKALGYRRSVFDETGNPSDELVVAETLVNIGALLLNVWLLHSYIPSRKDMSPASFAKSALKIYAKYRETGGVDEELRFHQALQLYASSIYYLDAYADFGVAKPRVLRMLEECLSWSRNHPRNSYESVFESVSGGILVKEVK